MKYLMTVLLLLVITPRPNRPIARNPDNRPYTQEYKQGYYGRPGYRGQYYTRPSYDTGYGRYKIRGWKTSQ